MVLLVFLVVLGIKPQAFCMQGNHWIMFSTFNTIQYYMLLINGSLNQFKLYTSLVGK